jgi:hypothetical protein
LHTRESLFNTQLGEGGAVQDAKTLAKAVLKADPSLEWVTVFDENGELLSYARSDRISADPPVSEETISKLLALDAVTLAAFRRAEEWYGETDFVLMAHRNAQVILVADRARRMVVAAMTGRSGNPEYLFARIKSVLGRKHRRAGPHGRA